MKQRQSPQWCEKHWDVVRKDKSINGIAASMMVMQEFINSTFVGELTDHSPRAMQKAMESVAPLCCWLGEEKMQQIYKEATNDPRRIT